MSTKNTKATKFFFVFFVPFVDRNSLWRPELGQQIFVRG